MSPRSILYALLGVEAILAHRAAERDGLAAEYADPEGYAGDNGRCAHLFAACPWWYRAARSTWGVLCNTVDDFMEASR